MPSSGGKTNNPQSQDGVSAVPSGSGLTFLLESSFEEDDNPGSLVPTGFEPVPEKGRTNRPGAAMEEEDNDVVGEGEEDDQDQDNDDDEDSDVTAAKRGRELTDKYLAG